MHSFCDTEPPSDQQCGIKTESAQLTQVPSTLLTVSQLLTTLYSVHCLPKLTVVRLRIFSLCT